MMNLYEKDARHTFRNNKNDKVLRNRGEQVERRSSDVTIQRMIELRI